VLRLHLWQDARHVSARARTLSISNDSAAYAVSYDGFRFYPVSLKFTCSATAQLCKRPACPTYSTNSASVSPHQYCRPLSCEVYTTLRLTGQLHHSAFLPVAGEKRPMTLVLSHAQTACVIVAINCHPLWHNVQSFVGIHKHLWGENVLSRAVGVTSNQCTAPQVH